MRPHIARLESGIVESFDNRQGTVFVRCDGGTYATFKLVAPGAQEPAIGDRLEWTSQRPRTAVNNATRGINQVLIDNPRFGLSRDEAQVYFQSDR